MMPSLDDVATDSIPRGLPARQKFLVIQTCLIIPAAPPAGHVTSDRTNISGAITILELTAIRAVVKRRPDGVPST